jgi:hypothetical protein
MNRARDSPGQDRRSLPRAGGIGATPGRSKLPCSQAIPLPKWKFVGSGATTGTRNVVVCDGWCFLCRGMPLGHGPSAYEVCHWGTCTGSHYPSASESARRDRPRTIPSGYCEEIPPPGSRHRTGSLTLPPRSGSGSPSCPSFYPHPDERGDPPDLPVAWRLAWLPGVSEGNGHSKRFCEGVRPRMGGQARWVSPRG